MLSLPHLLQSVPAYHLLHAVHGVSKLPAAQQLQFLAKALDLQFSRVQFTPDVMPSDVTGFSIYHKETGKMEYQPGAVMCNRGAGGAAG